MANVNSSLVKRRKTVIGVIVVLILVVVFVYSYVVYMNGTVARLKSGNTKAIEPGCEIIVTSKDPKKRMSPAEVIGLGTSTASLATMIATMVNLFK